MEPLLPVGPMDRRRCTAHSSRTGERCRRFAVRGGTVCPSHGGAARQVRQAAAVRVATARASQFAALEDVMPVSDPIRALLSIGGQAVALVDVLRAQVAQLNSARQFDGQVAADLTAYLGALQRAESILTNISRLGIEERLARLQEHQAAQLMEAVVHTFAALALTAEQERAGRQVLATELRKLTARDVPSIERGAA